LSDSEKAKRRVVIAKGCPLPGARIRRRVLSTIAQGCVGKWRGLNCIKSRKGETKTLKASFGVGLFILAATLSGPIQVCRAQILVGGWTNQTASPLASVPAAGTFFSAQLNLPPWPMDWLPAQVPVYAYGSNTFIVDDRGWDYSASGNALFAASGQGGGMGAMVSGGPPPPSGGGTNSSGTNSPGAVGVPGYQTPSYSTNDLYLTNIVLANGTTAEFEIHPPSYINATNAMWDVFYTTNLAPPISWQWVLTNAPGLTTLYVTNATNAQGFYTIGFPSAGTDFWPAFMATVVPDCFDSGTQWTLYISTQVTNTVTVTIPFQEPITNSLAAGTVTNITVGFGNIIYGYGSDSVYTNNAGIHITANQPVSV
jgi:hypothetical protein